MDVDWELAHNLTVDDGQGVRCACELPSSEDSYRLVVGTQGGSLYQWSLPSQALTPISYQHNHSVTTIISDSNNTYVTGCKDNSIRVFDGATHEMKRQLDGHTKAVTSLDWCGKNILVSGSWDGTAKIWNTTSGALLATLPDHENTVSVCGLPASDSEILWVATGSAGIAQNNTISNQSIRIWKINISTGEVNMKSKISNDHLGPIRDVALDTGTSLLASCSNDGTVKLRDVEKGECLQTLSFPINDPPMLLSITITSDGTLVGGAEDGHVAFWKASDSTTPPQLIPHAASVWTVASLKNSDMVTCCQDGFVRIFTQSHDRRAPSDIREKFEQSVKKALQKRKQGPSQEEVSKLPKWELNALQQGKSEGQVQIFQKDGVAIAAQWSAVSQTWIEVGQVVGGPNQENTGVIDGVQYDLILPIEVDQQGGGVATLQIGYNTGENPFVAAQRFIDAHMLPQHHLSEIADYIQQRVGKSAPTLGSTATTIPSTGVTFVAFEHLPMKGYKSFELSKATNFEKMIGKINEVGLLSNEEVATLKVLTENLSATNRYHANIVESSAFLIMQKILLEWPPTQAFPALDLARLTVLHPGSTSWNWEKLLLLAYSLCEKDKDSVPVAMLTLRFNANCFKTQPGVLDLKQVLLLTEKYLLSKNKNVRLSVVTVLLNVSSYLNVQPTAENVSQSVITQLASILDSKIYETEATVRALVALGTVLMARPEAKEVAKSLFLAGKIEMLASSHGEKAKATAKEIYVFLQ